MLSSSSNSAPPSLVGGAAASRRAMAAFTRATSLTEAAAPRSSGATVRINDAAAASTPPTAAASSTAAPSVGTRAGTPSPLPLFALPAAARGARRSGARRSRWLTATPVRRGAGAAARAAAAIILPAGRGTARAQRDGPRSALQATSCVRVVRPRALPQGTRLDRGQQRKYSHAKLASRASSARAWCQRAGAVCPQPRSARTRWTVRWTRR
mmetsp:Transcript_21397/g.66344  ORF Transcript_21397/g.66344 Transcript_21397/m.66344 type:complete len:211 (-) Transcript_21397:384-1016(-)